MIDWRNYLQMLPGLNLGFLPGATPMPGVPGPGAGRNPYMPQFPAPDMMSPHFAPPGAMGMIGPTSLDGGIIKRPGNSADNAAAASVLDAVNAVSPDPFVPSQRPSVAPPRNPAPAGPPPMMGVAPETYNVPALIAPSEPSLGASPQDASGSDWFERNKELVGPDGSLWRALGNMGAGMLAAPPGSSFLTGLNYGFANANRGLDAEPFRRERLEAIRDQREDRKARAARQTAYNEFVKGLPDGSLKRWAPFLTPEKLAEKAFEKPGPGLELDIETGKYRVNKEWLDAQIKMREASGQNETALMKNAQFISNSLGIPLNEAVNMARSQAGTNSVDHAAMSAYLRENPGKNAFDYMREKADMRRSSAKPTALMQNSQYLSRALGISEADAARIMSQSRELSDQGFYASIYRQAINSPMVAGDPQRADEIAKAAVQARKNFQGTGSPQGSPQSAPQGRRTATGPGGRKIYTEDGGRTWFNMDGSPFR